MNETIELDDEGAAAVQFLEKLLKDAGETLPPRSGIAKATNNPILPTTDPNPSNHPIHGDGSAHDQHERRMAEIYNASIRERPLTNETEAQRRNWLTENSAEYRDAARAMSAATTVGKTASVSKAEAVRQAAAEKAIHEAGEQFARERGISVEKARTIIRRAYRDLAKAELGR